VRESDRLAVTIPSRPCRGVTGRLPLFPKRATAHNVAIVLRSSGPSSRKMCFEDRAGHNVDGKHASNQAQFGSTEPGPRSCRLPKAPLRPLIEICALSEFQIMR
jgi:hypothetical protein